MNRDILKWNRFFFSLWFIAIELSFAYIQMGHQIILLWPFVGHLFNAFSTKFVIFVKQNIVSEKNFFHEDDFFLLLSWMSYSSFILFIYFFLESCLWVELFLLILFFVPLSCSKIEGNMCICPHLAHNLTISNHHTRDIQALSVI